MLPLLSSSFLFLALGVSAIRISTEGHLKRSSLRLGRRDTVGATTVGDLDDTTYTANITVGGSPFVVQIDTGSSDLWIDGEAGQTTDLGIPTSIQYVGNSVAGSISVADVIFAGYEIKDQAYINVTGSPLTGFDGIIGLTTYLNSVVWQAAQSSGGFNGDPFVDRVFQANTSLPNFISFTLERNDDPATPSTGEFTISELITGYENVTQRQAYPSQSNATAHWAVFLDTIIGPDGSNLTFQSVVAGAPSPIAALDTGYSLAPLPVDVANAIYQNVPGATYDSTDGFWILPCDAELNITFVIGGDLYPIHPLDTNTWIGATDQSGNPVCIGGFIPTDPSLFGGTIDLILGDPFLRNVYTLIDYGDFEDTNDPNPNPPTVQFLPLTDPAQAHADFVAVRINNSTTPTNPTGVIPTTTTPAPTDTPTDTTDTGLPAIPTDPTDPSDGNGDDGDGDDGDGDDGGDFSTNGGVKSGVKGAANKVKSSLTHNKKKIIIIVACVVGAIVIAGLLICCCCAAAFCGCLRKAGRRRSMGLKGQETRQVYQPLEAPVPEGHSQHYGYYGTQTA